MQKSSFQKEKEFLAKGFEFVVGLDEVGRGPLAGPVVAAAALLRDDVRNLVLENIPNSKDWDLVRDSKTLSAKQREKILNFIEENFHIGIGICDEKIIDRINILEASFLAMKKAVVELKLKLGKINLKIPDEKYIFLVDGNKKIPNCSFNQEPIIGGDGKTKSIAAASIAAKIIRDRMMCELHEKYPQYDFDKHKGYGTKLHMEKIHKYGPCQIHRKSFEPIKSLLKK